MLKFDSYNGFLFVGDPHLWSSGPGKRLDRNNFSNTVLNKIEQAVDLANEKNLYLIFLGDLFHVHTENNIELLTKLVRILNKLKNPCATVEGNHEKCQTKLSDGVALSLLKESGVINVLEYSGIWGEFKINNEYIYVGSTPYGEIVPSEVKGYDGKKVIWLTHHDFDFGDPYPGSIPLKEIKNVSILINGHIHKTKEKIIIGNMVAHNPGNITRLSIDCIDHIPCVWEWNVSCKQDLIPHKLNVEKNVFDLEGRMVSIDKKSPVVEDELNITQVSEFVEKMKIHSTPNDPNKTDDAAFLKENILALGMALNLDSLFIEEIMDFANESIDK
jgi:predicted phosphodiesterase